MIEEEQELEASDSRTEIQKYITEKGYFIDEKYFISKEDFDSSQFKALITNLIDTVFITTQKYAFAAISVYYLESNENSRIKLHNIVKEINNDFTSFSSKCNAFTYICPTKEEAFITSNSTEFDQFITKMFDYILHLKLSLGDDDLLDDDDEEDKQSNQTLAKSREEIERQNMKVLLPNITKCTFGSITDSGFNVFIDEIKLDSILQRNKGLTPGFHLKYKDAKLSYRLYLYNSISKSFDIINPEDKVLKGKVQFKLTKLQSNHLYLFKLTILFNNDITSHPKKQFYIRTKCSLNKEKSLFAYGNNSNGELVETSSPKFDAITYIDKVHSSLQHFSFTNTQSLLAMTDGKVINAGRYWMHQGKEDSLFDIEEMNCPDISMGYSEQAFIIDFPNAYIYITKVGVGNEHCIALSNTGQCFSWGSNCFGQLGLGIETNKVVGKPRLIKYPQEDIFIGDIEAGYNHNLAIGYCNGKSIPYSWGYCQGGEPTALNNIIRMEMLCSSKPNKLIFLPSENITQIYAKYNISAIIVYDIEDRMNHLYTFGINIFNQLGFVNQYVDKQKNWDLPTKVNYFSENRLSVLQVSFCEKYGLFLVYNQSESRNEVYITGECSLIQSEPIKLPEKLPINEANYIHYVCATIDSIYLLTPNHIVLVINKDNGIHSPLQLSIKDGANKWIFNYNTTKMEGINNNFLLMLKAINPLS